MQDFSWHCPYCDRSATITSSNFSGKFHVVDKNSKDEKIALHTSLITCPNSDCKEYTISAQLFLWRWLGNDWGPEGEPLLKWSLKPQSESKQFPDYIPQAITSDYEEACLIRDLSPKASATLSRRCLQGMIRDFFNVKEKTLFHEINAIKEKVDPLTWDAIDAVRSIGNIGAHMEKDINLIIDVDSNEAGLLIGLIESLIQDWYVARFERQQRLQTIVGVAEKKKAEKSQ
ncbi:DUF4145 domain-containing protein [Marinomonas posidonica]|uniref:DUF4145 domain-containing protein n=1 Tax=Marinomonas posidonica (strain CECT 7376 / NCIMB 14433 / IVIA-Po-181) TaxID=491952 RepID=F6CUZ6_MARPP|nr:DUF4145 domain-containing protein [Marinomonas posidonica]AEF55322.1 hypothetical protein Mar181_2286 [Marinomonas posidonica IVIA-Po-181]